MTRRGHSGMGMTKKRDGLGTGMTQRGFAAGMAVRDRKTGIRRIWLFFS